MWWVRVFLMGWTKALLGLIQAWCDPGPYIFIERLEAIVRKYTARNGFYLDARCFCYMLHDSGVIESYSFRGYGAPTWDTDIIHKLSSFQQQVSLYGDSSSSSDDDRVKV